MAKVYQFVPAQAQTGTVDPRRVADHPTGGNKGSKVKRRYRWRAGKCKPLVAVGWALGALATAPMWLVFIRG